MRERTEYLVKLAGESIKGYVVEEKIWQGATSTVYRCSSENGNGRYGKVLAIKVLHPYRNQPQHIKQFAREAKIQAMFNHENIVKVYGLAKKDAVLGIFMEFVNGTSLRIAAQNSEITNEWFIRFFLKLAETVEHIHKRGVIHNDLKPENIIVTRNGEMLKLTDFGYAEQLRGWFKKELSAGGTEKYMAPERARGAFDERSDVYSFGVLLDEYLKDRLQNERIYMIIAKSTEKEPFKRYASMTEVKEQLQRLYVEFTS